jgi:hypothetical protein
MGTTRRVIIWKKGYSDYTFVRIWETTRSMLSSKAEYPVDVFCGRSRSAQEVIRQYFTWTTGSLKDEVFTNILYYAALYHYIYRNYATSDSTVTRFILISDKHFL